MRIASRIVAARLERFWFEPVGPGNLGFARLVFFGLMFWFHRDFDYTIWGTLPASFQNANPIRLFELLGVGMPTVQGLGGGAVRLQGVAAARVRRTVHAIELLGRADQRHVRAGHAAHVRQDGPRRRHPRAGDAGPGAEPLRRRVVDRRVRRSWRAGPALRSHRAAASTPGPSAACGCSPRSSSSPRATRSSRTPASWRGRGRTTWPTRCSSTSIKSNPPTDWGVWLAQFPLLCRLLAAGTIIVEIAFPLALFSRVGAAHARARDVPRAGLHRPDDGRVVHPVHVHLPVLGAVRRDRPIRRPRARRRDSSAAPRFFDGGCGFCRKTVAVLWHLDVLRRCELFDVVNDWPLIASRFPAARPARRASKTCTSFCEDGRVFTGFDAYRQLAWVLPATWTCCRCCTCRRCGGWAGGLSLRRLAPSRRGLRPMIPTPGEAASHGRHRRTHGLRISCHTTRRTSSTAAHSRCA